MGRKLSNWLETYNNYVEPETESPLTFIKWSGLFCLSAALRRNVYIPKKLMGKYDIFPNLYLLFIAPAGRARKSTILNVSEDLLGAVNPYVHIAPTATTKEKLVNILADADNLDSSTAIISGEYSSFIAKSGIEMYELLTDLFDAKKKFSVEILSRDSEIAEKPCVNLIAATTPTWVAENMPESVIGGGFASRVIFIYEEKVRRHKLFYDDVDSDGQAKLEEDLIHDLRHIAETIEGIYSPDNAARKFASDWYDKSEEEFESREASQIDGYWQRRHVHMLKLAIIIAAAKRDELVIRVEDLKESIKYLEEVEQKMSKTFNLVGKNKHAADLDKIIAFIQSRKSVERKVILERFRNVGLKDVLDQILSTAVDMKAITIRIKDGRTFYNG